MRLLPRPEAEKYAYERSFLVERYRVVNRSDIRETLLTIAVCAWEAFKKDKVRNLGPSSRPDTVYYWNFVDYLAEGGPSHKAIEKAKTEEAIHV